MSGVPIENARPSSPAKGAIQAPAEGNSPPYNRELEQLDVFLANTMLTILNTAETVLDPSGRLTKLLAKQHR